MLSYIFSPRPVLLCFRNSHRPLQRKKIADPPSIVSTVAGLLSPTIDLMKLTHQHSSSAKRASKNIESLVKELIALKNVLSDIQDRVVLDGDVAKIFLTRLSSTSASIGLPLYRVSDQ